MIERKALHRHDLIYFERDCIDEVLSGAQCVQPFAPQRWRDELSTAAGQLIPGIARRGSGGGGEYADVGFVLPWRVEGVHCRVAARVPLCKVSRVVSPFEVMQQATATNREARRLDALGRACGAELGLVGSHAMHAVTGLGYVDEASDIDVIVCGAGKALADFARQAGGAADAEARILMDGEAYDIRLQELLGKGEWVMAKTLREVLLLRRRDLCLDF